MIITADDLGLDGATNNAILGALDDHLVSHASLLPNGQAFRAACDLVHERGLERRIGVHLVLTEGVPLTDPIRRCDRFCDHAGDFVNWRLASHRPILSATERAAVKTELHAQIERCAAAGVSPAHADSHHHVHTDPTIAPIAVGVVRAAGIHRLRLARNCGPRGSLVGFGYRAGLNLVIRRLGLAACRYFGGVDDYAYMLARGVPRLVATNIELVTHPRVDPRYGSRIFDLDRPDIDLAERLSAVACDVRVAHAPGADSRT